MGVLAQAKNGDQKFLEIEISCSQWEGSACTQSALIFFLSSFGWWWGGGGGGGGDFFNFYFVPNMFPSSSHQVPNMCPRFPMCSPKVFPIAPCFNPICFAQSPPPLTYIGGPKREALHLSIESSIWEASIVSTFFCNRPIKLAHCKENKKPQAQPTPRTDHLPDQSAPFRRASARCWGAADCLRVRRLIAGFGADTSDG
jgi:hypothetical protein